MRSRPGSPSSEPERRRAGRRTPAADEALRRVRLRTGQELTVLNLSGTGALVEGPTRLLPNTHIVIHIVTRAGRLLMRCRVARAFVSSLQDGVTYRVALAFDHAVDVTPGYVIPSRFSGLADGPGTEYPLAAPEDQDDVGTRRSA